MNFHLLDMVGSGADFTGLFIGGFIILILAWALIEGTIINLFHITAFWRSILHAAIINIASLIFGVVFLTIISQLDLETPDGVFDSKSLSFWGLSLLLTIVIEALLLKALNQSALWRKIFIASIVMNIVTYTGMYLIFK